ncbi:MAG: C40 family peptidase [Lautropia sp.]
MRDSTESASPDPRRDRHAPRTGSSASPSPTRRAALGSLLRAPLALPAVGAGASLLLSACAQTQPGLERQPPDVATPGSSTARPAPHDRQVEVVLQAMALIGVPYQWGGNDPEEGLDCSGLVVHVYEEAAGIRLPRTSRQISARGRRVARTTLREADLVFFTTTRQRFSHVGIYVGDGRFVHAPSTGSTVRLDSVSNAWWARRFAGARRLLA